MNGSYLDWNQRILHISRWLNVVRREINSPDLWTSIKEAKYLQASVVSSDISNAPFTPAERSIVITRLEEVKRYITQSSQLQTEQLERLEGQILYLIESSERLGRKDRYNILISVLFSIIVTGVVTPDRAQELFQIVAAMFEPLLRSIMQLNP